MWSLDLRRISKALESGEGREVQEISDSTIQLVERSRPGYGAVARGYLAAGHVGVAVVIDANIISMGWCFINAEPHNLRVKGYYPLRSNHALLHADWTHPDYRGRGLHLTTIVERVRLIRAGSSARSAEASIAERNAASAVNYDRAGFKIVNQLVVAHAGPLAFSRFFK